MKNRVDEARPAREWAVWRMLSNLLGGAVAACVAFGLLADAIIELAEPGSLADVLRSGIGDFGEETFLWAAGLLLPAAVAFRMRRRARKALSGAVPAEPVDWRGEAASLVAFLRDGIAGRGWRVPTMGGGDPARADEVHAATARAIREARLAARKTQEHLALEAGISSRTLRTAETTGRVGFENLRGICAALDIPLPAPPDQARAAAPRRWVEGAHAVGILAAVVLSAGLFFAPLCRTWRQRALAASAAVALALASSGGIRWAIPADDIPAVHANTTATYVATWDAVSVFALAGVCAGFLIGAAWRSGSPRAAAATALVAASILAWADGPMEQAERQLAFEAGRAEGGVVAWMAYDAFMRACAKPGSGCDPAADYGLGSLTAATKVARMPVEPWTDPARPVGERVDLLRQDREHRWAEIRRRADERPGAAAPSGREAPPSR